MTTLEENLPYLSIKQINTYKITTKIINKAIETVEIYRESPSEDDLIISLRVRELIGLEKELEGCAMEGVYTLGHNRMDDQTTKMVLNSIKHHINTLLESYNH